MRGRTLLAVELLVDWHHAVGVHHHVATKAVLEVGGVEGGNILGGRLVPLGGMVEDLVHSVIARVEFKWSVKIIKIIKKVQGVHVRKSQLI